MTLSVTMNQGAIYFEVMRKPSQVSIGKSLKQLQLSVNQFINFFEQGYHYQIKINRLWNAKDVLGHITFWHESFARNVSDLGEGRIPNPLKGKLSEVNEQSVATTREASISDLVQRLKQAQKTISFYIFDENIEMIPYKKGSRDYSRAEHLEVASRHIDKHLKDLRKSLKHAQT